MATDTAFAIDVLAILASRVSISVGVFLTALAIFDDIGAIVIVAFFYGGDLNLSMLLCAALVVVIMYAFNIVGLRQSWFFGISAILLWLCVHESGLHATLAGLLAALTIPAKTRISQTGLVTTMRSLLLSFEQRIKLDGKILESHEQHVLTEDMKLSVRAASTPLQRWEESLINPIAIVVLPLFVLFNAGVSFSGEALELAFDSSVTWGIFAGLVIGKPLGIVLFCAIGMWSRIGVLPAHISKSEVVAVGFLAGIGFTMSTFITSLSFEYYPEHIEPAKLGVLLASFTAAMIALGFLSLTSRNPNVN